MSEKMRILIAYDGSKYADDALAQLCRAGLPAEADAEVLSVADVLLPATVPSIPMVGPLLSVQSPTVSREWRDRAFRAVDDAHSIASQASEVVRRRFPRWNVTPASDGESPAWAIIKKASDWGADLIVVGSHGRSALGRLFLGSVSQRVLNDAHCSVLIARKSARADSEPVRVVIGVDGSPESKLAVDRVAEGKWPAGSEARLVTAHVPLMIPAAEWYEEDYRSERDYLDSMLAFEGEKLRGAGLEVESVFRDGDPRRVLLDEAENWKADFLFVGARGLRRIERFLIGSVSASIAAHAHCSVEVVRA